LDIKMLLAKWTFLTKERHKDDLELKRAVESEPNFEPSINAAEIGVAVKNGFIHLELWTVTLHAASGTIAGPFNSRSRRWHR
jgi:hypothetical protein